MLPLAVKERDQQVSESRVRLVTVMITALGPLCPWCRSPGLALFGSTLQGACCHGTWYTFGAQQTFFFFNEWIK